MEEIVISLDVMVGMFIKILMVLLTILGIIMVRQADLMDRVVNVPVGGWFKGLALTYFLICGILMLGIVIVV